MLSREFFQAFADALATSVSTITHWASGYNGPSDMEWVKDMAEALAEGIKISHSGSRGTWFTVGLSAL